MANSVSTVVVGAGHAGLAASYHLSRAGIDHILLEKGSVGETWRSQRWDSFALNTNNRISALPGQPPDGADPEAFALKDELVGRFERYVEVCKLPVRTGIEVTCVEEGPREGTFRIRTASEKSEETIHCRNVIVASGFQNKPVVPMFSQSIRADVLQLHSASYRNSSSLPPGAVLVVGSAQSGVQIAEDLIAAGRHVFLSTSAVARVPRRYRGRDIIDWFIETGFWDVRLRDLEDPKVQFAAQPQVSGVGARGRTVSLQALARRGAILLGRIADVEGCTLRFADSLQVAIRFADERSEFFKRMIDKYIDSRGLSVERFEPDPDDLPDDGLSRRNSACQLDLRHEDIRSVIWCTGFTGSFDWIRLPAFGSDGRPVHERGVSAVAGVYFLGAPWLYKRKSGNLYGMTEDAAYIVRHVSETRRETQRKAQLPAAGPKRTADT